MIFFLITSFWLAMNYFLWRAEFAVNPNLASAIPVDTVWRKILTAPDDSSLAVLMDGERIGYCRWNATIGEAPAVGQPGSAAELPEGRVLHWTGYTVDLDGHVLLRTMITNRLRFSLHATFDTNRSWQTFRLGLALKPLRWEIDADQARQSARIRQWISEEPMWERTVALSALRDPAALLQELAGGLAGPVAGALPVQAPALAQAGLDWEARTDWLKVGRSRIRVHRLSARILDRHRVAVTVSRVGEILRVDLPNRIALENDALFIR